MRRTEAKQILDFLINNYDGPRQDKWFDLMDILLDTILEDARANNYGSLLKDYPAFYSQG